MCEISTLLLIVCMCIEAYNRTYRSQIFIFLLFCLITIWIYYFTNVTLCDFSSSFDVFFSVFIACFYLFYFASSFFFQKIKIKFNMTFSALNYKTFFYCSMLFCYYELIYGAYLVYVNSYAGLRTLINDGGISLHSAVTIALISCFLFIEYMYLHRKKMLLLLLVTMFILAILSTSKIFVVLAVMYAFPWYIKESKIGLKGIFIMLVVISVLSMLINSMKGAVASYEGTTSGWLPLLYTLHGYYLGGLAAFQLYLDGFVFPVNGWVRTGLWLGNVYSAFTSLFAERDYLIFLIRVAIMGVFYGMFVKKADSLMYLKVYSWLALLMIFYDNMFGADQLICFIVSAILVNIFSNQLKSANKI